MKRENINQFPLLVLHFSFPSFSLPGPPPLERTDSHSSYWCFVVFKETHNLEPRPFYATLFRKLSSPLLGFTMADKPSRALVVYGYGLAPFITQSHAHLHSVASRGCCGFLALDIPSHSLGIEDKVRVTELAQLLDAPQSSNEAKDSESQSQLSVPTISERFMGMKAAVVTDNPAVKAFCEKLGFAAITFDELKSNETSADTAASEILMLLGFKNGKVSDINQFDLIFVDVGLSNRKPNEQSSDVDFANNMIGQIVQVAEPGSEIGCRLHLSVVMSYSSTVENDPSLSLASLCDRSNPELLDLMPRQSYALRRGNIRNLIRHHCPMLMAQLQEAVTRRDKVKIFCFDEFRKLCGNLAIPADRFLYEIAFKLWKAPKYGA